MASSPSSSIATTRRRVPEDRGDSPRYTMEASTRLARIPRINPASGTESEQFESTSQSCLQHFFALRADGDTNSQLFQPPADRVRRHAKDAGDGEHRAHHAQHTQRDRRHMRGTARNRPLLAPCFDVSRAARDPGRAAYSLWPPPACRGSRLERITRLVATGWRLQDGKEHGRLPDRP